MLRHRQAGRAGCLVALCLAAVVGRADDPPAVLARAFIPSAANVHGETLVQRTGTNACCVRTILHSSSFRRGIKEIMAKEAALWPEQKPGYEDSRRYREALEQAKQDVVGTPRTDAEVGAPYTMVMDFVFMPGSCYIELSRGEVVKGDDGFSVLSQEPISRTVVSDTYMSRAMLVMTTAALGPERHDAAHILASAGWSDVSPSTDPSAPVPVR